MKFVSHRDMSLFRARLDGPRRVEQAVERVVARHADKDGGVIRPVRPGTDEDYPSELADRLYDLEPQFFLRNVPRVERYVDDELELEYVDLGDEYEDAHVAAMTPLARPELLDKTSVDHLGEQRSEMRRLFFEEDWTRRFGHELKSKLKEMNRAVWAYDPDRDELQK